MGLLDTHRDQAIVDGKPHTELDEDLYQLPVYKRFPLTVANGQGCWVKDTRGNEFLDFYGGHAVASTGHCHPRVVARLQSQAANLMFYSNVVGLDVRGEAARRLIEMAGKPFTRTFFVNSGSEAVENAFKISRQATGRPRILSFEGAFHGRTLGAISACGIEKYRKSIGIDVSGYCVLPWEDTDRLRAELARGDVAAVITEPIQSLAGVREASSEFLCAMRELTSEFGSLLIFDEIQTGVGRTGHFLYSGTHGVFPDLITLAKGLGSGFPVGAVLCTSDVARSVTLGDLGTTFGGGPLAMAAVDETLAVIASEKLDQNATRCFRAIHDALGGLVGSLEVRGKGLLVGLRYEEGSRMLFDALLARNIIIGTSDDPMVARIMPPLCLKDADLRIFVEALTQVISLSKERAVNA